MQKFLGAVYDYTLTYISTYKGETKTADVKLIADQAKKAFILQGLAADIPVAFDLFVSI